MMEVPDEMFEGIDVFAKIAVDKRKPGKKAKTKTKIYFKQVMMLEAASWLV